MIVWGLFNSHHLLFDLHFCVEGQVTVIITNIGSFQTKLQLKCPA